MLVCPTTMAPAARSFATMVASSRRDQLEARPREALPAGGGHLPLDAGVRLDDDRHAPQRATRGAPPPLRRCGVLTCRLGQRLVAEHRLDRAVDAVVAVDAGEVPLHDLRDGVRPGVVEAMQRRHRDVEQVAVDVGGGRDCRSLGRRRPSAADHGNQEEDGEETTEASKENSPVVGHRGRQGAGVSSGCQHAPAPSPQSLAPGPRSDRLPLILGLHRHRVEERHHRRAARRRPSRSGAAARPAAWR